MLSLGYNAIIACLKLLDVSFIYIKRKPFKIIIKIRDELRCLRICSCYGMYFQILLFLIAQVFIRFY